MKGWVMRPTGVLLLVGVMLSASLAGARADEIPLDDPHWLQLSDVDRAELEKSLRDTGVIGADDRLVYKAPTGSSVKQSNNPTLIVYEKGTEGFKRAAKAIASGAAYALNAIRLKKCRANGDETEKKACKEREAARFSAAKSKLP